MEFGNECDKVCIPRVDRGSHKHLKPGGKKGEFDPKCHFLDTVVFNR